MRYIILTLVLSATMDSGPNGGSFLSPRMMPIDSYQWVNHQWAPNQWPPTLCRPSLPSSPLCMLVSRAKDKANVANPHQLAQQYEYEQTYHYGVRQHVQQATSLSLPLELQMVSIHCMDWKEEAGHCLKSHSQMTCSRDSQFCIDVLTRRMHSSLVLSGCRRM